MTLQLPAYAPPRRFTELTGISRPQIYRHLAKGEFRAIKNGRTTLIDVPHAMEFLNARPAATFRAPKPEIAK